MNPVRAILFSLLVCFALRAEEQRIMPGELVGSVQIWMEENLEDWVFDAAGVDRQTVDDSLTLVQKELNDALPTCTEPHRQDADQMLLVLREFEGTRPYAAWLHSFLDQVREVHTPTNTVQKSPAPPTPQETRARWLSIMTKRAAPAKADNYLVQIKPIFHAEKVPAELAWVAEVESAFNPDAKSPVGAVGLFQLMPDTAKSLGLSTWFPDERKNAKKNARAAAQYLQYLHNRFGDWQLALAAYNAGPTRVARLLRKSDDYSYDAIAHRLPAETRDYVAKVEAILFLREGVELASLQPPKG